MIKNSLISFQVPEVFFCRLHFLFKPHVAYILFLVSISPNFLLSIKGNLIHIEVTLYLLEIFGSRLFNGVRLCLDNFYWIGIGKWVYNLTTCLMKMIEISFQLFCFHIFLALVFIGYPICSSFTHWTVLPRYCNSLF